MVHIVEKENVKRIIKKNLHWFDFVLMWFYCTVPVCAIAILSVTLVMCQNVYMYYQTFSQSGSPASLVSTQ